MLDQWPDHGELSRDVVVCEQEGDRITHDIIQRLNSTFVTPIDREDIYALASGMDDVVGDRRRDGDRDEGADEVEQRGEGDRDLGPRRAGRDRGGDDVRRVVEAVGEVEGERRADDDQENDVGVH
jgi:hypothetical protein